MTEIVEVSHKLTSLASYDPERDIIIIDGNLKNFPKLYDKVLRHEIDHSESFKNGIDFWRIIRKELIDYPRIYFDGEYYKFLELRSNNGIKRKFDNNDKNTLILIEFISQLYAGLCQIILWPVFLYKKYRKR